MKKKNMRIAVTAVLCIILNIAGGIFTSAFPVPFWLDTTGTMISACIYGPFVGAVVGFVSNLISRLFFGGSSIIFSLINIMIGAVVGFIAKKGMCDSLFGALCTGILVGIITVVCAVPVNCILFDGRTNTLWGDALFDMLSQYRVGTVVKSIFSQMFLDIPDKVISIAVAYFAVRALKKHGIVPQKGDLKNENKE